MGSPSQKSKREWQEYQEWLSARRSIKNAMRMEKPEPRRCPVCGCYQFIYQGDRQLCADCGRE